MKKAEEKIQYAEAAATETQCTLLSGNPDCNARAFWGGRYSRNFWLRLAAKLG